MMWLYSVIFYVYALLLLGAAVMVVVSRNPVRAALFLILAFFSSAVLWMMLEAEFLALVLLFVYVGAVMTLFLFVVMMLDVDWIAQREGFVRYLPFGVLVIVLLAGMIMYVVAPGHFSLSSAQPMLSSPEHSNVNELGLVLYNHYVLALEVASALLLVAIISAIGLSYRGKGDRKSQRISEQLMADPKARLRLVKMKVERRS